MSLVGSYTQPYAVQPAAETLYAPYYATASRFEPPPPEPPYYGWPFGGGNPGTPDSMSPLTADYSPPPPYGTPSPGNAVLCPQGMTLDVSGAELGLLGSDHIITPRRGVKRRVTANKKERRRTMSINNAFADLRDCIPNVPADTKLSKIKTLRLATSYIAYLMDLLSQEDHCRAAETGTGGFKAELTKKFESREEKRKKEIATLVGGMHHEKKTKGRTGWPQHVWALELQHD